MHALAIDSALCNFGCTGQTAETVVQSGSSDDFSKERKMLEKLIKDLKQTREDLETTDKEWKKKVNIIDQQLVPILPLERVVNHEILLVRHAKFHRSSALLRCPAV